MLKTAVPINCGPSMFSLWQVLVSPLFKGLKKGNDLLPVSSRGGGWGGFSTLGGQCRFCCVEEVHWFCSIMVVKKRKTNSVKRVLWPFSCEGWALSPI